MEWVVVECCGVSCRRICICPHHSPLKHITVMVIKSTKQKDTKFLMDAIYICGYVVVQCLCVTNGEQMVL